MTRKVSGDIIAVTEDTQDPVLRVTIGDSKGYIIVATESDCLNIWYIQSEQKGDMKKMLDYVVKKTGLDWLQFIHPMGDEEKEVLQTLIEDISRERGIEVDKTLHDRNIEEALDGFQRVEEEFDGNEVELLVGFWEVDR